MAYPVPAREARFEQTIRKSRFIGIARRVGSEEEVDAALRAVKDEYPDATHHSWAYVLGEPQRSARIRMHDDGEPAGTAGRPILSVVERKDIGDILIVVVRYFGGTKLGAGGLVRAYRSTASGVIDALELTDSTPEKRARLDLDYADEPQVERLLEKLGVEVSSRSYVERVELTLRVPEDLWSDVSAAVRNATSGRAKLVAI